MNERLNATLRKLLGVEPKGTQPIKKGPETQNENSFSLVGLTDLYSLVQGTHTVPDFIRGLESLVSHCHPSVNMSEREIWMKVGERNLVERLTTILTQLEQSEPED